MAPCHHSVLQTAIAAYARERRRNSELVHRLQQMHGEQVDMLTMKKRWGSAQGRVVGQSTPFKKKHQAAHLPAQKMTAEALAVYAGSTGQLA